MLDVIIKCIYAVEHITGRRWMSARRWAAKQLINKL